MTERFAGERPTVYCWRGGGLAPAFYLEGSRDPIAWWPAMGRLPNAVDAEMIYWRWRQRGARIPRDEVRAMLQGEPT